MPKPSKEWHASPCDGSVCASQDAASPGRALIRQAERSGAVARHPCYHADNLLKTVWNVLVDSEGHAGFFRDSYLIVLMQALKKFLTKERLGHFTADRNDPNKPGALSGLSPYLHYGQLGAQRMGLEASKIRKQLKVSLSQIITGRQHILTIFFQPD